MDRAAVANDPGFSAVRETSGAVASISAVAWSAVIAGAVVATATSLVLFALASGLGLASVSPWPGSGASLTAFSVGTGIGLIVVQWIAASIGGYITGRLRTRWVGTHTHEVFFRDTAHGFITWALSTIIVTAIVATGVMSVASKLVSAAGHGAAGVASAGTPGSAVPESARQGINTPSDYNIDVLFRTAQPGTASPATTAEARAEATRILTRSLITGTVPDADRSYLAQVVAATTGISQTDAQTRVDSVIAAVKSDETKARQAADAARKASSAASIFTALSMVIGAFIACVSAALGGRLRDQHP